jgi:hypothetical protein
MLDLAVKAGTGGAFSRRRIRDNKASFSPLRRAAAEFVCGLASVSVSLGIHGLERDVDGMKVYLSGLHLPRRQSGKYIWRNGGR